METSDQSQKKARRSGPVSPPEAVNEGSDEETGQGRCEELEPQRQYDGRSGCTPIVVSALSSTHENARPLVAIQSANSPAAPNTRQAKTRPRHTI